MTERLYALAVERTLDQERQRRAGAAPQPSGDVGGERVIRALIAKQLEPLRSRCAAIERELDPARPGSLVDMIAEQIGMKSAAALDRLDDLEARIVKLEAPQAPSGADAASGGMAGTPKAPRALSGHFQAIAAIV